MASKGLSAGAILLLVPLALAGCGEDLTSGQLVGTWEADKIEFVNQANTSQRVDVIQLGMGLTVAYTSDGRYALTVDDNGSISTATGSWEIVDGRLVWYGDVDPDPVRFDASVSGNRLTATTSDAEYDFAPGGGDEPAILNLEMTRTP